MQQVEDIDYLVEEGGRRCLFKDAEGGQISNAQLILVKGRTNACCQFHHQQQRRRLLCKPRLVTGTPTSTAPRGEKKPQDKQKIRPRSF